MKPINELIDIYETTAHFAYLWDFMSPLHLQKFHIHSDRIRRTPEGHAIPYTREEVLKRLKRAVGVGLGSVQRRAVLSALFQGDIVTMWLMALEDDLSPQFIDEHQCITQEPFIAVAKRYGWEKEFYEQGLITQAEVAM